MNFLNQTRFIERLQFFNGQRLFATDLQGLEAFNREMRWLHNKSLHQPGIGNGLAVSGKKGDRQVTIGPGYAIDDEGGEIVLTQSAVEPVPPVAGEEDGRPALFDLTISYPDDALLEETERREGICRQPGGVIRLQEEPVFCWVRLKENGQPLDGQLKSEIAAGMRIVLARAEVLNCQLDKDISIAQRLSARPAKQPYVCCGTVEPDWRPWMIAKFEPEKTVAGREAFTRTGIYPFIFPIGLQAEIDTSKCGFLTIPCYSARIAGPRIKQITTETGAGHPVALGTATITAAPPGNVVTVNDASPFRVGDIVTENNISRETITKIAGNKLMLTAALPGLAVNDTLRIANVPPSQATLRLTSVTELQANGEAMMRGDNASNPGNTVNDRIFIQSINASANIVSLSTTLVRTNTYNLDVPDTNAPVIIPLQTIPVVVDGQVQIINPLPNTFTVQILLLVATDSEEINFAALAGRGAAKRQASQMEEAAHKFIKDNFSDWHLVWMGVEG